MHNSHASEQMPAGPTRGEPLVILTHREIAELLDMAECIDAVERAFRLHAQGRSIPPGVLAAHVDDGGFHVKTAGLELGRRYFVAKVNANFPDNRARFGLPTIQGVVALFDATCGSVLALLDSAAITSVRTAAATAVAARHLALPDASTVTICGCGEQGREQLRAVARVRPIRIVHAIDIDRRRAEEFARDLSTELGLDVRTGRSLADAAAASEIIVTCTPSRRPLLWRGQPRPGAFVAAVGADDAAKQEIEPALLAESVVVVDSLAQCAVMGDLHHAIGAGLMTPAQVRAELGEIVSGAKTGRASADEVIIFDSTGTALQDVAAATLVYERAHARTDASSSRQNPTPIPSPSIR